MNRWVLALGVTLGAASSAAAQEACLRPVPPEEVRPPSDDREFRDFLNQEYQAYLLAMQDYLNCLGREHESATKEINEIMARWMLWFGDDARIRSNSREPAQPCGLVEMGGERGPTQVQHVKLKPLVYVVFERQPRGRVDSRPHLGRLQRRTLSLLRDALPGR